MVDYESIIENSLPPTDEDHWQLVRSKGRFPDRYVEGLDRRMAEALWAGAQQRFPNMTIDEGSNKVPMPLYYAAGGWGEDHFAIGLSKGVIEQGRACAALARTAIETLLDNIDDIDITPNLA